MKKFFALLIVIFIVSCKSKAVLAEANANNIILAEKVIDGHYNNKIDFSTLYIKANAKYVDEKLSQSVTAEIKIKKDEKILVSIRFLGITMAKALITPTSVQYYEKINGSYFEGDYDSLSQWLGSSLDFQKVQNLLLGKPIEDLHKAKYSTELVDKLYKLSNSNGEETKTAYYFEAENYLLKKQEIAQPLLERMLLISYLGYQIKEERYLPLNFKIEAKQKKGNNTIDIEYKTVTINEDLSFPYSVPEGYERVFIK
jgi:Domain of unknown function (DUF4292)